MGLDMYLNAKFYVKQWNHQSEEEKFVVTVLRGGKPFEGIKSERIAYVEEQVGYWRKANAIHQWFVDNVQDGVDECQEAYVPIEALKELRDRCQKVLDASKLVEGEITNGYRITKDGKEPILERGKYIEDHSVAEQLLPTTSGFFFGSTEYDQWYYQDIEDTIKIMDAAIEASEAGAWIYYQSSW